jgi:hypothetical protein
MVELDGAESMQTAPDSPPGWDRFAHWPAFRARLALAALALILAASALVSIDAGKSTIATPSFIGNLVARHDGAERKRDDDLALYDRAIERIRHGENYYDFIVAEHRRADYPVRPALAVRLPTLAYIDAYLGDAGQIVASIVLMMAVLAAWWRRFGVEPGGRGPRRIATALLFLGVSLGLNRYYFVMHELWAGMLLALSFGLHRVANSQSRSPDGGEHAASRTGAWGWSLAAAALAVAIRELALPFILLMGAMAFWRRDWKEGAAWSTLALVFLALLAIHLHIITQQQLPSDREGASWLALRGLGGWLSNITLSSNLRFLPHWLAGPAIIAMVFGWAGWRSPAGSFGTLLYLGYALIFMIAGRPDNFYWGAMIAPAMFIGLAYAPLALFSLLGSALPKQLHAEPGCSKTRPA